MSPWICLELKCGSPLLSGYTIHPTNERTVINVRRQNKSEFNAEKSVCALFTLVLTNYLVRDSDFWLSVILLRWFRIIVMLLSMEE